MTRIPDGVSSDDLSDSPIQEEAMSARFRPSITALGIGAAVAVAAAIPAAGAAATHHAPTSRHTSEHARHVAVTGLIAAHHGRSLAIFAKKVTAGATTAHNKRVTVSFARDVHSDARHTVGNRIHLSAIGRMSGSHITVLRHNDETVQSSPASLAFGVIDAINGNFLTVSMQNHDDGEHHSGRDQNDGDDNDNARPADHSPGGPGDGGDNSGPGQSVTVDATNAVVSVDGSTGTLAVGDVVAILGEYNNGEVVAADIFGFTNAPDFVRGDITAINGNTVTVGDDNDGHQGDGDDSATPARHGGDDGNDDVSVTASLTNVPLALNGTLGATTNSLTVGDKLILIGSNDSATGVFTADIGFAFNSDDHNPCGHNDDGNDHGGDNGGDGGDGGDGGGHGGDGGDGGSDG
jgi:hypothetical protein